MSQIRCAWRLSTSMGVPVGRIAINFVNRSANPIDQIQVQIPEVPFLRLQASQPPVRLEPGGQGTHFLQVELLQPFLQPPKYLVQFVAAGQRQPSQLPLTLPCILTKFILPAELSNQQFAQYFQDMQGPQRESQMTAVVKTPPAQ